jgi:hypothetical protein
LSRQRRGCDRAAYLIPPRGIKLGVVSSEFGDQKKVRNIEEF